MTLATMTRHLLIGLSISLGLLATVSTPAAAAQASGGTCAAPWNGNTAYMAGMTVSVDNTNYVANWWNRAETPASNSGGPGSGQPWTNQGACSGSPPSSGSCAAPWNSGTAYTSGAVVSVGGNNYVADYWSQGQNPSSNNGGTGSGSPWTPRGSCTASGSGTPPTSTGLTPPISKSTQSPTGGNSTPPTSGSTPVRSSGSTLPLGTISPTGGPLVFVFSAYKDISVGMNWNTNIISTSVTGSNKPITQVMTATNPMLTWAFATGECGSESWAGLTPTQVANNVQAFVNAGMRYIIATGGADGAFTCSSDSGFDAFIQTYYSANLLGIDFDIEVGQSASVISSLVARVKAAEAKYPNLRFSFTIATTGGNAEPTLNSTGESVVSAIKAAGLTQYYIDLMVMDYGSPDPSICVVVDGKCEMGQSAVAAAESAHNHYGIPYHQIELTPMIGGNDSHGETFTIPDVATMVSYVKANQLGGIHFWSFDRDRDCAPNNTASDTCNTYGLAGTLGFTNAFVKDLAGGQ